MKLRGWKPDVAWKWWKWTFGFWHDADNCTFLGIDVGPLEIVWRYEGVSTMKVCDFPKDKPLYDCLGSVEWLEIAKAAIAECSFPDMTFRVTVDGRGAVYLQGSYMEADTVTGVQEMQFTRRWFLSPSMSKSEIVATVFKCALTSMEHRTREWFKYNNRAVFMPHYNVDKLWAICEERQKRD